MIGAQQTGSCEKVVEIDEGIAREVYKAYVTKFGNIQTLDRINERGGFWLSEVERFITDGLLRPEVKSLILASGEAA